MIVKILMTLMIWAGSRLFDSVDIEADESGEYVVSIRFFNEEDEA